MKTSDSTIIDAPEKIAGQKHAEAIGTVKRFAGYGAVVGLIPLPIVDGIALVGLQVKMVGELAQIYGVPFNSSAVKVYVAALIGGIVPVSPIAGVAIRSMRFLPVVGPILGVAVVPAFASALTWATGRYFVSEFEQGRDPLATDLGKAKEWVQRTVSRTGGTVDTATPAGAAA